MIGRAVFAGAGHDVGIAVQTALFVAAGIAALAAAVLTGLPADVDRQPAAAARAAA